MKKVVAIIMVVMFLSCEKGIHKTYTKTSKAKDFTEMSSQISDEDKNLLEKYIEDRESKNEVLEGTIYAQLLKEAKDKEAKIQEELVLKKEREERQKREKEKAEKKKLESEAIAAILCNKKWKIKEYALQLEIQENSTENIELAQKVLDKAMFIKDSKLAYSIVYDDNKTYVRGKVDERVTKFFNGNNKNWKQYYEDGTYVEKSGNIEEKGTWEVVNSEMIKELRPAESNIRIRRKKYTYVKIKELNNNTFQFYEGETAMYNSEVDFNTVVLMTAK